MNNSVKRTNLHTLGRPGSMRADFICAMVLALVATLLLSGCGVPICGIKVVNASQFDVRELYIVKYDRDVRQAEDDYTAIQWGRPFAWEYSRTQQNFVGSPLPNDFDKNITLAPGAFVGLNIPFFRGSRKKDRFVYVKVGKDADTSAKIGLPIRSGDWYELSYDGKALHLKQDAGDALKTAPDF